MKKILIFLILLGIIAFGSNFNSSTQGEYGSGTCYFSSAMDSSWWLFAYDSTDNYYDTVTGFANGNYQIVTKVSLDSVGTHLVKIYGFSGGAYADSAFGAWEVLAALSAIFDYDVDAYQESTSGEFGQYLVNIGKHNVSSTIPTIQMKFGAGYTGAAGSNLEDDIDSARADIAAKPDSINIDGAINARIPDIAQAASESTLVDSLAYQGEPCEGNGDYLVILQVFDEADNPLGSTFLTVTNGGDATYYPVTNANGLDSLMLNSGNWYVYAYNSTYLQNSIPQTVVVSATMTDTIEMTSQATGSGYVRLWATAFDYQNGSPIEGAVLTVRPTMYGWINTSTGGTYLPKRMGVKTDSTGLASIVVPRTSSVTPSGTDSLKYIAGFTASGYFDLTSAEFIGYDSVSQAITWTIREGN